MGSNKSTQPPLIDGLDNWNRPAKFWSYGRRLYKKHWIYKKNKLVFEFRLREWIVLFKERQVILEWSYLPLSQELFQHSRDNIIKYFADPSKSVYFNVNIDSSENIIKFAMMQYQSLNPKTTESIYSKVIWRSEQLLIFHRLSKTISRTSQQRKIFS